MDLQENITPVYRTEAQWMDILSEAAYRITRLGQTEPPFTGDMWKNGTVGTYHCAGCNLPVFPSDAKFDSGTGWPSFSDLVNSKFIRNRLDTTHQDLRIEVHCGRCQSHLGHVFPDGPEPTGLRYCINALSLHFQPEKKSEADR